MAKYLFHGSYTQAGIQGVLKDGGTGRRKAVDALAEIGPQGLIDGETRTLAETARQLNEVNRRVRNLLAANVAARIEALGGPRRMPRATYTPARA